MSRFVRGSAALAALPLTAFLAAACGSQNVPHAAAPKAPVTFRTHPTTPTSTVAATTTTATVGPQGIKLETGPFLADGSTTMLGAPVDGILCQQLQQLAYRGYAHLQVYDHGRSRALPGGIGMLTATARAEPGGLVYSASTCYYWLHTRAADGVIVIAAPVRRTFTLGDFFAVWDQPLTADQVAGLDGRVTVLVNGKRWRGKIGSVPLRDHDDIELAVGGPVPRPAPVDWVASGL